MTHMISEHERLEAFRRELPRVHVRTDPQWFPEAKRSIAASTDPAWMREQYGVHQYSRTFTVCMLFLGTAAAYGILFACASI